MQTKTIKSKILSFILIIMVYGFVFNPWTSFPYTFIIIIAAVIAIAYWSDKSLSSIGLKVDKSFLKIIGISALLFIIIEPLLDFVVQPLVSKLTSEPADYSMFQSIEGDFPKYLK